MKHILLVAISFSILAGLTNCKKKDSLSPVNCGSNAQEVVDAMTRYSQNPDKANCEAYKKEIVDFIKSCPTYYGAVEKRDLEEFANEPCD